MNKRIKELITLTVFGLLATLIMLGIHYGLISLNINSKFLDAIEEIFPICLIVYISIIYFRPIPEGYTLKSRERKILLRVGIAMVVLVLLKYFEILPYTN